MMKKMMKLTAIILAVGAMMGITACTLSDSQIKLAANLAGQGAALAWQSFDHPTTTQKVAVVEILTEIRSNIGIVGTNKYVDVMYPIAQKYIADSTKIPAADKTLVSAGVLGVLSGVDMMFASHPEWKADVQKASGYVGSFIDGAVSGLKMPDSSEEIKAVNKHAAIRVQMKLAK